ncbi:MAG: DJ-1/PfpI family protein [Candidatus Aenigmatarchaeota archaeon]
MADILMVIAPKNFRDEELLEPKEVFELHGYDVAIASEKAETAKGKLGTEVDVDADLHDVDAADFVAIVFVGGGGCAQYFDNAKALDLAKKAADQGKVVAAICIAPTILANAGVLKGKRATCYETARASIEAKGAKFVDEPVVVDGSIVTANGPEAARAFGEAIVKVLSGAKPEPEARERHKEGEGRHRRKRHGRY